MNIKDYWKDKKICGKCESQSDLRDCVIWIEKRIDEVNRQEIIQSELKCPNCGTPQSFVIHKPISKTKQ